ERIVRNTHRVGTHVGDQCHRAVLSHLHAFVETLCQRHGALGRVTQTVVRRLLKLRGREGRRRIAALLLLCHACHFPRSASRSSDDGVGFCLRVYFHFLALKLG